ncbi:MAG: hypothetical protein FWF44_09725, partial [Defluviitaleaceae bacterium]|nr:hypothetical protein [Defluviitaleaceae bacterium]
MTNMLYNSTRNTNGAPGVTASAAILQGLAPDGGLYVPASFPSASQDWPRFAA